MGFNADVGVIVPAAGRGTRMGGRGPKALLRIDGAPMVLHTLRRVAALRPAEIVLVLPPEALPAAVRRWGPALRRAGVTAMVPGGARRQDSVAAGLAALGPACRWVVVHDAARPLLPAAAAAAALRAARRAGAAIVAVPCSDTLKQVGPMSRVRGPKSGRDFGHRTFGVGRVGHVTRTVPRERVWRVQTPQVVRRDLLERGYARAGRRTVTDESGLVEALGVRVAVVPGSALNLKVTTPDDLALVRGILRAASGRRPEE